MNLHDLARLALDVALQLRVRERVAVTVEPRKVEVVVFDPERDRRLEGGPVEETGCRLHDHKVTVEIWRGVVRVTYIHPAPGDGPATRDQRVPLDDCTPEIVARMIRMAVEAGRTPF